MNYQLTRFQLWTLVTWFIAFTLFALFPHFGAPHFRYAGSTPDQHVWNLGWPLATCIYDPKTSPHLFVSPMAYIYAMIGLSLPTFGYFSFCAWNNRGLLATTVSRT